MVAVVEKDYPEVVNVEEETHQVAVVSDLHLSGGQYEEDGKYRATENFFYDDEFAGFLGYLQRNRGEKPWKLIINGDFIDFIRLTETPSPDDYEHWQSILREAGIDMEIGELRVSDREHDLGLKTHEYKSVWKMDFIGNAHLRFFRALARFIDQGNRLVIIKGNHDVEFYWDKVRLKLKQLILRHLDYTDSDPEAARVLERIEFCDRAYVLESKIYVEHGHQYEKITSVRKPIWGGEELTLPYGSLINRYLLNKVELIGPFLDNIKPPTAYLDAIFKNYPIRAIRTLIRYVPLTWEILKKRYYWETMRLLLKIVKYSLIPLVLIFLVLLPSISSSFRMWLSSVPFVGGALADLKVTSIISIAAVILPFVLPTVMRKDLVTPALRKITRRYPGLKYVILGHFHGPDQRRYGSCLYYNSGSWTPTIDLQEKLKASVQFCVVLINKNQSGQFETPVLRQWNHCSGRLEKIVLIESASPRAHQEKSRMYQEI